MRLSVIVPTLNEAHGISVFLTALQALRANGHEIIVVDGGSSDNTAGFAFPLADKIIHAPKGRALQMNAGAAQAKNDVLLFVHADTYLPAQADQHIMDCLARTKKSWGRFDVSLTGLHPMLKVIAWCMNKRSRLTGIATGDQAIFVTHQMFQSVGGYPAIALMEDIALCTLLRQKSAPLCLDAKVVSSGRRWEKHGLWRTLFFMWRLRLEYFFGADPQQLARRYHS